MPAERLRVLPTIRKAVFPAAGLGTRFLPATKAQPKEMLTLVDKPIIQYSVEEAAAAGIDHVVLVTGQGTKVVEDHFKINAELEALLESRGKGDLLAEVRNVPCPSSISTVQQGEPLGLGHAVILAHELIGDEAFAVILSDDVIDATPPAVRQLIDVYERLDGPVVGVERVSADRISDYGIVDAEPVSNHAGVYRIHDMVEKPTREDSPSDLAIVGRYILTPDIFPILNTTQPDAQGEIQLTDALRQLLTGRPIYACEIDGTPYDIGVPEGYVRTVQAFGV